MSFKPPRWLRIAAVLALHLAALGLLYQTEYGLYGQTLFVLTVSYTHLTLPTNREV